MNHNDEDPYYMGNREVLPVKVIFKTNYANYEQELPWDAGAGVILNAVYSIMVGMTFHEVDLLHAMKEFAEEKLSTLEPEEDVYEAEGEEENESPHK